MQQIAMVSLSDFRFLQLFQSEWAGFLRIAFKTENSEPVTFLWPTETVYPYRNCFCWR